MAENSTEKWPGIERRIREGRGQGTGADYIPWIHVREVSSSGKSHRLESWKSGRTLQLLSDIELSVAYLLDWSDAVIDYYEQYPLLPIEETFAIGESIGYTHPLDKKSREPRVRTTDFLVEIHGADGPEREAVAVKPAEHLSRRVTLQSLEVERRYWQARKIPWSIVTEREVSRALVSNIGWIHDARTLDGHDPAISKAPLGAILPALYEKLNSSDDSLAHSCLSMDKSLGLPAGGCLLLVRHQLAIKAWRVNMEERIRTDRPLLFLHSAAPAQPDFVQQAKSA